MFGKDESIEQNITTNGARNYTVVLTPPRPAAPPEKHSTIILPASRENLVPLQPPSVVQPSSVVSPSTVVKPNHVVTVGKNMTSNELCLIELQSMGVRTEQKSSMLLSQGSFVEPGISSTSQPNSSSEKSSNIAQVEKKSNVILPASRESLVPMQPPPQSTFKPPSRTSPVFPTAPKVMVRKFNLAYNSQTNTHLQNKLLTKVKTSDECPTVLSESDLVCAVNSDLCSSGSKFQLMKVNPTERNSILCRLQQSPQAIIANSTVGAISPLGSSQNTSTCIPVPAVPLKLVPTILKRSSAKTVVTPSGLQTTGSIPSVGSHSSVPVIIMNNKGATVTTAVNKPLVSLAGKSVITKDKKIFSIKFVDGKCVLYENVDSKTAAVSEVPNQLNVVKQVDLKVLKTPKFIKVDSCNGGYILKRCIQNNKDASNIVSKPPDATVIEEKRPTSPGQTNQLGLNLNLAASLEDGKSELIMRDTCMNSVGHKTVPNDTSVSYDAMSDGLEWDANEILKTLGGEPQETKHNLEKHEEEMKEINEILNVREVEIPARKVVVADAWSQTDLYSLMEQGKIVEMSIAPAAKYGSGSVIKKQTVTVPSAPFAVVERFPPVHSVAPCVQEVQSESKKLKLNVKGTEGILPNKENKSISDPLKEIQPVGNTSDDFDSTTLWHDLLKNCNATEIEPDQLMMETESLLDSKVLGNNDTSTVHDLIVKHNINKLCNKNKLIKNEGPIGGEYYKPNSRKRKQTFPSFSSKKPENCGKKAEDNYVKNFETNILAKDLKSPNVDSIGICGDALLDDSKLKSLVENKQLLQKLYYEWIESVQPDTDGNIELHYAVTEENVNLVRRQCMVLSARKFSVDIKNNDGETPLHLAVRNGHRQITQILLSYGADPCVKNMKGNNALHLAVLADSVGSLQALLGKDNPWTLPFNVLNDEGLAPLHLCAMNNKNKQLLELLAAGASVNLEDGKSGRTALFHAVEADNNQIVRILLAAGADSSLQNYSGHTPLHAASEVSVTDKRVMSELITNEGISSNGNIRTNRKPTLKRVKVINDSGDEDDPKCVRSRRKLRDRKF